MTRRIVAYGLVVLCMLPIPLGLLYMMYKADPPNYTRPSDYSTEEIEQQAARFATQAGRFANAMADERNLTPIDVEFTDEMINGYIRSRPTREVRSQMPTWLSNPQVVFTADAIVLMADVNHDRVEAVISVTIEPSLTDDKRLSLRITSQKAGRLPLPDIVRDPVSRLACGDDTRGLPLHEVQRRHVLAVLDDVGGNRAQAARLLEISERNLYRLLKRYEWSPPSHVADPDRKSGS